MAQRRLSQPEAGDPPLRPRLADQPSRFVLLEREVELEYRPQMLEAYNARSTRWRRRPASSCQSVHNVANP